MLSNAYFLAKFRFDRAENEPAKNLPILLTLTLNQPYLRGAGRGDEAAAQRDQVRRRERDLGKRGLANLAKQLLENNRPRQARAPRSSNHTSSSRRTTAEDMLI